MNSWGFSDRLASVRDLGLSVSRLEESPNTILQILIQACNEAIEKDGAEAIILGCLGMRAFAKEIVQNVHVSVIEPLSVALKVAESYVKLGLTHSRSSYPKPMKKKRVF